MHDNKLYYGDNLDVLRKEIRDISVDLVYLDPPFNSKRSYNVLFKNKFGEEAQAQIQAFDDTWTWSQESEQVYQEILTEGPTTLADALEGLRQVLAGHEPDSGNDVLAYLVMMAPRLLELHRKLKTTGSLYLHCDPTASHYLKLILDSIFGPTQFRNEIIWRRTGSHNSPRRFGPVHDVILFYSKSDDYYFTRNYRPYLKGHVKNYFNRQDDRGRYWTNALTGSGVRGGESGQPWRGYNPTEHGRHWAIPSKISNELDLDQELPLQQRLDALDSAGFIDHPPVGSDALPTYRQYLTKSPGLPLQDLWAYQPHTRGVLAGTMEGIDEDVRWLVAQGDKERLGYQTQKPVGLLKRIITSSCPPNGMVLDPFCGCGTTVDAAEELGRRWIGIDITYLSIDLISNRLRGRHGEEIADRYDIEGIPRDIPGARALFQADPFDFERWAVSLVHGQSNEKQVGDKGIDGRVRFPVSTTNNKTDKIIVSVKGGKSLNPGMVRDLIGSVRNSRAAMGFLITLEEPTPGMRRAARESGAYRWPYNDQRFPLVQILTIGELLEGKRPDAPPPLAPYLQARILIRPMEDQQTQLGF